MLCENVKTYHSDTGFVGGFVAMNSGQISNEGSTIGQPVDEVVVTMLMDNTYDGLLTDGSVTDLFGHADPLAVYVPEVDRLQLLGEPSVDAVQVVDVALDELVQPDLVLVEIAPVGLAGLAELLREAIDCATGE